MVRVNDLIEKIDAIVSYTDDEVLLKECLSWLETCRVMTDLGFQYLTLPDDGESDVGTFNIH